MKYITTKNEDTEELEIFTFPDSVPHNVMAEATSHMKSQIGGFWKRVRREPISAGFICEGQCYGESVSLGLKSRGKEDDNLLIGALPKEIEDPFDVREAAILTELFRSE